VIVESQVHEDGAPALSRRRLMKGVASASLLWVLPLDPRATPASMREALREAFGDQAITPGRVQLTLPALAENGNSVSLTVAVDSPMSDEDHVRFIQLFSPENPLPDIARFEFTSASGVAEVETRIRLSAEQDVLAVAGLSDGSLWSASAHIVVTEAACIDALI